MVVGDCGCQGRRERVEKDEDLYILCGRKARICVWILGSELELVYLR